MLFMITQVHPPETCPKDSGGADALIDMNAEGVTVKGRWGGLEPLHYLVLGGSR